MLDAFGFAVLFFVYTGIIYLGGFYHGRRVERERWFSSGSYIERLKGECADAKSTTEETS